MNSELQINQRTHSVRDRNNIAPTARLVPPNESWAPRNGAAKSGSTVSPPRRYRSLLVPVDGSPFGEHALPLALGIARRAGASVTVVHVHTPMESAFQHNGRRYESGIDALLRERQQAYLDDLFRRIKKVSSVPVVPVLMQGREVSDSVYAAARTGTDLVVMATHAQGPLARFWSGSVADNLTRRLSIPVLLVRGYTAPADLTGDPHLRHVLIPLDGTEFAEQVLEPAITLGTPTDHTLLRVIPRSVDYLAGYSGSMSDGLHPASLHAETRSYLRRVANRYSARTHRIHARVVLDEQPTSKAIVDFAHRHDADVIAIATHGRGGVARMRHGSVANRVVRGTSLPVLMFRPSNETNGSAMLGQEK